MKLKSELYIQEAMFLLEGIELKAKQLVSTLKTEKTKAQWACFFAPWIAGSIWSMLAIKSEIILQQMKSLSELHEKILLAEGQDDDMQVITLSQIIENYRQTN
jgi:hypothetical protein